MLRINSRNWISLYIRTANYELFTFFKSNGYKCNFFMLNFIWISLKFSAKTHVDMYICKMNIYIHIYLVQDAVLDVMFYWSRSNWILFLESFSWVVIFTLLLAGILVTHWTIIANTNDIVFAILQLKGMQGQNWWLFDVDDLLDYPTLGVFW